MRNIDPAIFSDDFIGSQSLRLRWLWIGMITFADDQGRLLDKPLSIKAMILPYDVKITARDIESDLKLLTKNKKIIRYTSKDGRALIQIINWWRYQVNAQWASRSLYPAPLKWMDRVRCHEKGHGTSVVTENWEQPGGFTKPLPSAKVKATKPLPSREDEDEDKANEKDKDELKTYPPTLPPSRPNANASGRKAGGEKKNSRSSSTWEEQIKTLPPKKRKSAELVRRVFSTSGLRDPKLSTLSVTVATRNYNGTLINMVLGALASAYADKSANNKSVVAAHRLELEQVNGEFKKPKAWNVIPQEILSAAGIDDLRAFILDQNINSFVN